MLPDVVWNSMTLWYTWLGVYKQPRYGVGYDIPSLSARYCAAFGRSASTFSAELQDAMADEESESREGAATTQDQFALLMGAFSASQARLEERFAEFRAEIRLGQEDAAAKALKRARYEKPYEYKCKSNQDQAAFNAKVDEAVAEAEHQIEEAGPSTAPALERAKEALKKGRKFIWDRQKLIKIADRSEHGWGVVQEYTADELAEDSGDEAVHYRW